MTHDEAVAALSANSAALVFAGRDYDALAATFGGLYDPDVSPKIAAFRRALANAPDTPARLVLTTDASAELAGILAARERDKAACEALQAQHARDVAQRHRELAAAQARREKSHRTLFPAFQTLRGRIQAAETAFGEAATPADIAAAEQVLADAFTAATTSISMGAASFLVAA